MRPVCKIFATGLVASRLKMGTFDLRELLDQSAEMRSFGMEAGPRKPV